MIAPEQKALFFELLYRAGYSSPDELATTLGVPGSTVRGWIFDGRHPRRREDAEDVADALYTDVETLFPGWKPVSMRKIDGDGNFMLRAMADAGYDSITSFADKLGVSANTAARWTDENNPPAPLMAYKIAGLLNVATSDLWPKLDSIECPLMEALVDAGFESVSAFCRDASIPIPTFTSWVSSNCKPRREAAERCAKVLGTTVQRIFPMHNWDEDKDKQSSLGKAREGENPEPVGFKVMRRKTDPLDNEDLGGDGMSEIRRKADVWVGRRFVITTHHKDGTLRRPAVVEECQDRWFRVRYAKGYCECFSYHCILHDSECKCFRSPDKGRSANPLSAAGR